VSYFWAGWRVIHTTFGLTPAARFEWLHGGILPEVFGGGGKKKKKPPPPPRGPGGGWAANLFIDVVLGSVSGRYFRRLAGMRLVGRDEL